MEKFKVADHPIITLPIYDVATITWGDKWCMPNISQSWIMIMDLMRMLLVV